MSRPLVEQYRELQHLVGPRPDGRGRPRVGDYFGKYRIRRRIAAGGFATVYEALDRIEGRRVALKIPLAVDSESREWFRREVRLAARLEHPNILPLKSADVIDGLLVCAFPLGDESLHHRLARRMSINVGLEYSEQILAGLAHVHQHGIVHCDIKPENFIVFPGRQLRLADFGLAKTSARMLRGSASGTVEYMAPEHQEGRPSMRSDVFSAGLVIYRLLTGVLPEAPSTPPSDPRWRTWPEARAHLLSLALGGFWAERREFPLAR